jgi:hypothetical protein
MIDAHDLTVPAVRDLVLAINAGDRAAFLAALAPDATMSDDGTARDLEAWIDREIFSADGHIEIESEADGGHALLAKYTNSTWGDMRTTWAFELGDGGRIRHFATGQA